MARQSTVRRKRGVTRRIVHTRGRIRPVRGAWPRVRNLRMGAHPTGSRPPLHGLRSDDWATITLWRLNGWLAPPDHRLPGPLSSQGGLVISGSDVVGASLPLSPSPKPLLTVAAREGGRHELLERRPGRLPALVHANHQLVHQPSCLRANPQALSQARASRLKGAKVRNGIRSGGATHPRKASAFGCRTADLYRCRADDRRALLAHDIEPSSRPRCSESTRRRRCRRWP
jgi:hypothetical protein